MASLGAMQKPTASGTSQSTEGQPQSAAMGQAPFVRASILHREQGGYDYTTTMGAGIVNLPDFLVPAYGYVRHLKLTVTTYDGAGNGTAAGASKFYEDGPFNALQDIVYQEPNGAHIHNVKNGHFLYLINKFGGYRWSDPRTYTSFVADEATGNFRFTLRVPVELNLRDSLGSLPNQNSAAQFRLKLNLAALSQLYTTAPTTPPKVRVKAEIAAWDQPEDNTDGMRNQTTPPAMNTTQFWSTQQFPVHTGQQHIKLTRVGNYIRNLIFVLKSRATDADPYTRLAGGKAWPDPLTIFYDTRPLDQISRPEWDDWSEDIFQKAGSYGVGLGQAGVKFAPDTGHGQENGVFPYSWSHEFDGWAGMENRDQWLKTLSSTRLEVGGQWNTIESGTLHVLTNDVVTVGNVFL